VCSSFTELKTGTFFKNISTHPSVFEYEADVNIAALILVGFGLLVKTEENRVNMFEHGTLKYHRDSVRSSPARNAGAAVTPPDRNPTPPAASGMNFAEC
jgi:hypothetical protein